MKVGDVVRFKYDDANNSYEFIAKITTFPVGAGFRGDYFNVRDIRSGTLTPFISRNGLFCFGSASEVRVIKNEGWFAEPTKTVKLYPLKGDQTEAVVDLEAKVVIVGCHTFPFSTIRALYDATLTTK